MGFSIFVCVIVYLVSNHLWSKRRKPVRSVVMDEGLTVYSTPEKSVYDIMFGLIFDTGFKKEVRVRGHKVPLFNPKLKMVIDINHTNPLRAAEEKVIDRNLSRYGIKTIRFDQELIIDRGLSFRNEVIEEVSCGKI